MNLTLIDRGARGRKHSTLPYKYDQRIGMQANTTEKSKEKNLNMSEESATIGKGLPEVLSAQLMPKHVAFIADGNRRWANERGLPAELGHCAGKRALVELTFLSRKWGIKVVSIFAFSTENWKRPKTRDGNESSLRRVSRNRDEFCRES
ncbi:UNVERIFIED_CONTAM: Dehydrodolichyl diphosphate synthase 2 [Sesamum angustifolium]|uniref:Dehydrodolichyl diphosphate synthase 2 n=1 Tax=Sesamum angustifolium TaxID=2727405 RepID=A0AAW2QR87_9LAMI